jgi:hypothetical protein
MNTIEVKWADVGWGCLGFGGNLGWESKRVKPPDNLHGWEYISAHAQSCVLVEVKHPIRLVGFFGLTAHNPASPVTFYASGNYVGKVAKTGESTLTKYGEFRLWPGLHLLEIVPDTTNKSGCHSAWAYKDVD